MGFDDRESTVLIGGGHTIGKCHGACSPEEAVNGKCDGGSADGSTFTSGLEGSWTTTPTVWSNQYFNNLLNFDYILDETPARALQWKPATGPATGEDIMMLTPDVGLSKDEGFLKFVELYAYENALFEQDFAKAWYRLTTSDMGPASRCIGDMVPEPQPFQRTLPAVSTGIFDAIDYISVAESIDDYMDQNPDAVEMFIQLALNCASTFRATDYKGGCNGARIRFPPESEWESNSDVFEYLAPLEQIKTNAGQGSSPSMADMIVLAGVVALEKTNPDLELRYVLLRDAFY